MAKTRQDQPRKWWDRLFAPSSCLAMVTTVDRDGHINAASYGTCTRVKHEPVFIAFTANEGSHTARNVRDTGEFVVNLSSFDKASLAAVRVVGLPFAAQVNELEKAGLAALPSTVVKPPRIEQCPRHFECKLSWEKEWSGRVMIVGEVVAASFDAGCVDDQGYILWDRVRPAHYCGAPYGGKFVAAYETMDADVPYEGPEVAAFFAQERAMFKEI